MPDEYGHQVRTIIIVSIFTLILAAVLVVASFFI
jgi:hypothetical protein